MNGNPLPSQREMDSFCNAAGAGDMCAVLTFLDKYPDAIDWQGAFGDTALIRAISQRQKSIVEALLTRGADVNARNRYGDTALIEAVYVKHGEIVTLLLEKKAAVDAPQEGVWTVLAGAVWSGRMDIVELLLEKGASLTAKNKDGSTILMWASCNDHAETVAFLLKKGVDMSEKDNMGWTALTHALHKGHHQVAALLEEAEEKQRQALTEKQKREAVQAAEVLAAANLEKLKRSRPAKNVLKRNFPRHM